MSTADPQLQSSLTILFEVPFWIGLYERIENGKYEVCKITFGAEPKDYEIYEFLLKNWGRLRFSPPIKAEATLEKKINPKRMQREINSQLQDRGIGTKAQQALKLQHEQYKLERKTQSREQREAEKERQYALRQEKKEGQASWPVGIYFICFLQTAVNKEEVIVSDTSLF